MSYALITGGSKGIGQAIARDLARRHFNLLLVARGEKALADHAGQLQTAYGVQVHYLSCDLSLPDAAGQVAGWVLNNGWGLKILVNNAGYGRWGNFHELSLSAQQKMLRINVNTLFDLTHLLIPNLQLNKPAYILNVGSMAGFQAMATLNAYAASKSFVNLFSRALHDELKPTGISVTLLSPGSVNTNFVSSSGMQHMEKIARRTAMTADQVAEIAIKALFKGKKQITPGWTNRLVSLLIKHLPKQLVERVAASAYKLKAQQ